MSEVDTEIPVVQDELATLKHRADMLGISYHPSIGVEKLREKVRAALEEAAPATASQEEEPSVPEEETLAQKRVRLRKEAAALVRIRVTCMNPAKAEWEGEVFTAGNASVGSFRKYVPFNADEGWHVPNIIYKQMRDRQCQVFTTVRDSRGNSVRKGKLIREFAIEVLPQLTKAELEELARRQAMAGSID